MEEKKKLCIRNKDAEGELKKQAIDEAERMRKKLADRKGELDGRLKESRAALESNDEVRLIKGKLARKEKEINDIRKKTDVSEANFKRLRDEVQKLEIGTASKKGKNEENKRKFEQLKAVQNE